MFKKLSRHAAAAAFALAACASAANAQTAPTPAPTQTPAPSSAGHEYAPLIEQKIDYKDWTFKSLKDGSPVNLREWAKGKKLVMVVYFAPWCGNWKMEAPVVARLLDKYRKDGFDVIAVNEYASADDSRKYFDSQGGSPYTVVVESEGREARDQTTHYGYRQACNDKRRWGSPFNVFLEPSKLNAQGEVLTEKAWVVGGELIETDAERFIREKLGLTEKSAVEPCEVKP
jgi:thiol-disulfide isomerase/thioredoxin